MKKKLVYVITGALLTVLLGGCGTEESELSENQRYAYAVVTSIEGNEITYIEVDESQAISTEEDTEEEDAGEEETNGNGGSASGDEKAPGDGEAPSGAPDGEAPGSGEAPDMDATEMPSEAEGAKTSGTTVSTQIPVGVTVHTASGTETTFSRIAVGDVLKILLETDEDGNEVIVEIWMIES